jgi:hypothetical protein
VEKDEAGSYGQSRRNFSGGSIPQVMAVVAAGIFLQIILVIFLG